MLLNSNLIKIFNDLKIRVDEKLLRTALTHSSVTFENNEEGNYERLEFLGDSVLKLAMSDILYNTYPDYDEGRMTKVRGILISDNELAKIGRFLDLPKIIMVGNNEKKDGGSEKSSVIACVLEAILGAIYLSCGFEKSMDFVKNIFTGIVNDIDIHLDFYNAKAVLQEYTQGISKDLPEYKLIEEKGLAHDKTFFYEIYYHGELLSKGAGKTKREAQQEAAKAACLKLGILKGEDDE